MAQRLGPGGPAEGFRERNRRQRREEFLEVALAIVSDEGLGALTMQRVTAEVGCATGSIYNYFPTKGALVAEVQLQALQMLGRSLVAGQFHLEAILAQREFAPDLAALTRMVVAARFWIAAEATFPREIEMNRRLFTEPGLVLADDEAAPVVSPSLALLDLASGLISAATVTGALQPGSERERSVLLIAGTTGVMLTSHLSRWDEQLFDGAGLARTLLDNLLVAWGVRPDMHQAAIAVADELAADGRLVPVPDG